MYLCVRMNQKIVFKGGGGFPPTHCNSLNMHVIDRMQYYQSSEIHEALGFNRM